jgi:uncharacterized protein (DUF2267 family)
MVAAISSPCRRSPMIGRCEALRLRCISTQTALIARNVIADFSCKDCIMTATHVTVLDHTVQETNAWLKGVAEQLGLDDRQLAYNALRAVLHTLRDRIPPEVAVKMGAQLPMLVRGMYYEGWHPATTPTKERHIEDFAQHVLSELPRQFPVEATKVARGVFEVLWEKLDPGEFEKVMNHLPASLRAMQA